MKEKYVRKKIKPDKIEIEKSRSDLIHELARVFNLCQADFYDKVLNMNDYTYIGDNRIAELINSMEDVGTFVAGLNRKHRGGGGGGMRG